MLFRPLLSAICLIGTLSVGHADAVSDQVTRAKVAKEVEHLVERDFYRTVDFPTLDAATVSDEDIDQALAGLEASHTRRILPGTIDYVEIASIYSRSLLANISRLFPPDGFVTYEGIGIVTAETGGRRFVTDVYDGSTAGRAGILVGDEILAVDGKPFQELASFKGHIGKTVTVSLRRRDGEKPMDFPVMVVAIDPSDMFARAIYASERAIDRAGLKIGYLRVWALASPRTDETIQSMVTTFPLKDADALIVDLRGRWGGYSQEIPKILVENRPNITFMGRDGRKHASLLGWRKPIVGLIDEGTRSANEIFAYLLRERGAELVGKRTAGAVLAGAAYFLPDDSLLMLATKVVEVNGVILEGGGVAPDVEVGFEVPYAAGLDPQLNAALDIAVKQSCADRRGEGQQVPALCR